MKTLVVGDPHAKLATLREIEAFKVSLVSKIKEIEPDLVVILGDLASNHSKMQLQVWNSIISFFNELLFETRVEIVYLIGNHDALNNQIFLEKDHWFNAFKHWDEEMGRLHIIDKAQEQYFKGQKFVFVPYVPPGRFREALKTKGGDWENIRAIFCHQEFKNAKMGAVTSKVGDEWSTTAPLVISGHIHDYDRLQENIIYVGTPYPVAFGESEKKTISLFDFDEKGYSESRIDLGLPKKLTMKMTVSDAQSFDIPDNCRIRLHLSGTVEELSKFRKTKKYKELDEKVKIIPKPTDRAVIKKNIERAGYVDILGKSIANESEEVRTLYEEVIRNASVA